MNWIQNIGQAITTVLAKARAPIQSIPPILLLCEILERPGISAITLAASTITRLQSAGIPTGVNPCGMENMNNKFVKIFAEEFVKHVKTYAKVESVIGTGDMSFIGQGGNAGGPIVMPMYNTNNGQIDGLIE